MPATHLVLNLLEEYVVVPSVIGHRLPLNPRRAFVWLIFGAGLRGVPGALMAVPLLAIVKIVCESRATAGVPSRNSSSNEVGRARFRLPTRTTEPMIKLAANKIRAVRISLPRK